MFIPRRRSHPGLPRPIRWCVRAVNRGRRLASFVSRRRRGRWPMASAYAGARVPSGTRRSGSRGITNTPLPIGVSIGCSGVRPASRVGDAGLSPCAARCRSLGANRGAPPDPGRSPHLQGRDGQSRDESGRHGSGLDNSGRDESRPDKSGRRVGRAWHPTLVPSGSGRPCRTGSVIDIRSRRGCPNLHRSDPDPGGVGVCIAATDF